MRSDRPEGRQGEELPRPARWLRRQFREVDLAGTFDSACVHNLMLCSDLPRTLIAI
jgi:hypothetical protein